MPEQTTHVRYYRTPGGALGHVEESHPGSTGLPEGAVEIDQTAYDEGIAAWQAAKDTYVDGLRQSERERAEADLQALLTVGVPEQTARRIIGRKLLDDPAKEV